MRGEPDADGVTHGVDSAALLVVERLHVAEQIKRGSGRTPANESRGGNGAGSGYADLLDVGMHGGCGIGGVEEGLAQAVGGGGSGEALVEQHGMIGNRGV